MTFTHLPPRLQSLFDAQHSASRAQAVVSLAVRRERLLKIRMLLDTHGAALAQAVQADFGVRSLQLTEIADLFVLRTLISSTLKNLPKWMKAVKVRTPLYLKPAHAYLQRQPLGVVGVISPWNYPVQLALGPVITALAAGTRVMLKPSELTPQTSALLADLIGQSFASDEVCVVQGDGSVAAEFASLPFGGVGESGWGAYHGETGFLRLTQQKPVLFQSRWARGDLFYPPYGRRYDQVMGLLKRLI
ncbi:MAG: aldehyde dehydrogenase family protein [Polaromonas sp.]